MSNTHAVDLALLRDSSTRTVTSGSARHSPRTRSTISSGTSTLKLASFAISKFFDQAALAQGRLILPRDWKSPAGRDSADNDGLNAVPPDAPEPGPRQQPVGAPPGARLVAPAADEGGQQQVENRSVSTSQPPGARTRAHSPSPAGWSAQ